MLSFLFAFAFSQVQITLSEERQYVQWMRTNNKYYTGDEYYLRLGIFLSNSRYIQEFNRKPGLTYRLAVNKFACYTPSEFKSILGALPQTHRKQSTGKIQNHLQLPDSVDWRDKGVVNPIKDQGDCGSCWAFSAISTSESAYAISTGTLLQFSEQNLIDCTICWGCMGGWPDQALDYILTTQTGQFASEQDYPYRAMDCACNVDFNKLVGKITTYETIKEADENDLLEKVALNGVASICIAAGNTPFMSYSSGILDDDQCTDIDHAVAAVGYGTENGIDYWIVRNSWGTSWGEEGYVRMIRNKDNKCLIASRALIALNDA